MKKVNKLLKSFDYIGFLIIHLHSLSYSCIDNLSNEILYEIFDYICSCRVYEAFSNLNARFQNFIIYLSILLKFNFCCT